MISIRHKEKLWNDREKQECRLISIVNKYKKFTGFSAVPTSKEYWTLGGKCIEEKTLISGSELHQLLERKFLTKTQFISIEMDKSIHLESVSYKGPTWIHGLLSNVIAESIYNNKFNPAIINYDSCSMYDKAEKELERILLLVDACYVSDIMISFMCIQRFFNKSQTTEEIKGLLLSNSVIKMILKKNWRLEEPYWYRHGRTEMFTIAFYKK